MRPTTLAPTVASTPRAGLIRVALAVAVLVGWSWGARARGDLEGGLPRAFLRGRRILGLRDEGHQEARPQVVLGARQRDRPGGEERGCDLEVRAGAEGLEPRRDAPVGGGGSPYGRRGALRPRRHAE